MKFVAEVIDKEIFYNIILEGKHIGRFFKFNNRWYASIKKGVSLSKEVWKIVELYGQKLNGDVK